jgi:hypothetical protein
MFEDRKKTGLLSKAGYNAQEEFLDLMEQQIELEKDEMVFETVQHIARQLRDRSIALRDLLKDWAAALALGSAERVSLHAALQRARVQVRARRAQADHFSRVRKEETDEEYERSLYERFAHQQLEAMFRRLEWRLADEGDVTLSLYGSPLMRVRRQERDRPTEENLKLLLGGTRRAFQSLVETESISKRLLPRYPPDALGRELHDNGSPLYSEKSAPPFARTANFLTVRYGETEGDEPYFRQVIGTLQGLTGAKGQAAQLVTSEGYHKCTLVYTKDILNADSMTTYDDLYNAYRSYADDRRLLHNFPAEVNAVYYEQRLQEKLRQTYRTFSPRIVFMLEHREWVRQFVRCLVHRLVDVQQDEERKPFWAADLPECEFKNRRFNHELIELGDHVTSGQPDLFQAMDTFVFLQKDYRQGWEVPLQEDHLVAALVQAENRVGDDGANVQALRGFIDGELIQELKRSQKEYERDLGDLMHLVLLDEIDRLSIRRTA